MEKTLREVYEFVKRESFPNTVKNEDDSVIVNGVNVLRIATRDSYSFTLQLLDMMFSKEELASSLLFKSKKSPKPGLDKERVEKLLNYVEMRFKDSYDLKVLTAKVNQKCRDAKDTDNP